MNVFRVVACSRDTTQEARGLETNLLGDSQQIISLTYCTLALPCQDVEAAGTGSLKTVLNLEDTSRTARGQKIMALPLASKRSGFGLGFDALNSLHK